MKVHVFHMRAFIRISADVRVGRPMVFAGSMSGAGHGAHDPHCFLAVFALRVDDDAATSQAETDRCLQLDPPVLIRSLIQQLTAPSASSVPATSVPG